MSTRSDQLRAFFDEGPGDSPRRRAEDRSGDSGRSRRVTAAEDADVEIPLDGDDGRAEPDLTDTELADTDTELADAGRSETGQDESDSVASTHATIDPAAITPEAEESAARATEGEERPPPSGSTMVETRPVNDPVPMPRGARPSSTLQAAWIDPEETPFEPVPRPGNPLTARLIAWAGVGLFLAALGWLILPELDLRVASRQSVQLQNGVLTAQPVQLAPVSPAIVSELYVDASSIPDGVLPEGSPIALLEGRAEDGTREVREIVTPFDARFVSVDTLAGGVVMPGTPVATVYDPSQMYVIVSVLPEWLELLRRGMRAELISEAAGVSIAGEVISAVPLLGTEHEPTTANLVNVRIKPDPDTVADLLPGIRFDAVIDLTSVGEDAQPLVFTYAGHIDPDEIAPSNDDASQGGD